MKTIRQRMTRPMILSAILVPLAVLLVFNVFMRLYMVTNARRDLKVTSTIMVSMIRQISGADNFTDGDGNLPQKLRQQLDQVRGVIRTTSRISGIDILIMSQDGRLLYPSADAAGLTANVLARLGKQVAVNLPAGQVATLRSLSGEYFFSKALLTENFPKRSPWIVSLTQYSPTRGVLLTINLVLLAILIAGSLASIAVSMRTARRISAPLDALARLAERIGQGHHQTVSPDAFCSEINRLQNSLNDMAGRLARSDHLQKAFLQDASHELRTPLMIIQGYAEGLQQGILSDSAGTAAIILNETHKLSQLVDSLLTLSRIENQAGQSEKTKIDLHDWLRDQIQRMDGLARREGRQIILKPGEDVAVETNEAMLEQTVRNILSNAVRYAAAIIEVQTGRDGQGAWIVIADDGQGISAADLPHIFDRFYKGSKGQNGLGLAIARSAIEAAGGRLTAGNRNGGGAEFLIRLP